MITKERLSKIYELSLSGKLNSMDESSFEEYCSALNLFVDTYPSREHELKVAQDKKIEIAQQKALEAIKDLLTSIYADGLVQRCVSLSAKLTAEGYLPEARLTRFLTSVSSLSISIQMAISSDNANPEAGSTRPGSGKIILAVDDVSLVLRTLNQIVADTDYKFVGFMSGYDALVYMNNNTPDLFILDIEMPKMDGYTLAQKIRERGHTAPIIFLTGNATKEYVFKAIQAGAADFVVKPVNVDQVLEKIERFMGL